MVAAQKIRVRGIRLCLKRPYPPRAVIIADRLTLVAAVRGMAVANSTVLGAL